MGWKESDMHTCIHTYILAVHAAEPGVDVVLVAREIVLGGLHADVYGAGPVDDVANMSSHVHRACGTAIVLPGGRRGGKERGRGKNVHMIASCMQNNSLTINP